MLRMPTARACVTAVVLCLGMAQGLAQQSPDDRGPAGAGPLPQSLRGPLARPPAGAGARPGTPRRARSAKKSATPAPVPPPPSSRALAAQRRTAPQLVVEQALDGRPRRVAPVEDPFAPIGVRAGAFVLRPALELKMGSDSNPRRVVNGAGSNAWVVAPELAVASDWQRHSLTAELRGSATGYDSAHAVNNQTLDAKAQGRIDVSRQSRIDLEGRARVASASPSNLDLPADLARLPHQTTVGTTLGVAHQFNRFEAALKGSMDRITWDPARLIDGSSINNRDRAYNQFGGAIRGSYDLIPGVKPFVEAGADVRHHDLPVDAQGIARDSTGRFVKVGTSFELTRKLTGEIALGRIARRYDDVTLPDLRGMLTEASLVWTASALTSVKLAARTTAEETILRGVSGMVMRDAEISVDHAFRRWLIGTVKLGHASENYVGSTLEIDRMWTAAAVTYKVSRELQLKGEVRREWRHANTPASDYTVTTVLAGLRLQR